MSTATRGDFILEILAVWDEIAKYFPELDSERELATEWLTKTFTTAELEQPVGDGSIRYSPKPELLNSRSPVRPPE